MGFVSPSGIVIAAEWTPRDLVSRTPVEWSSAAIWLLAAGTWFVLIGCCIALGWARKKDANGTLSRLLWVSACLGTLNALPALIIACFALRGPVLVDQCMFAAGSMFLNLLWFKCLLSPTGLSRGTKQELPLVTDEQFLRRIESIAQKMGHSVPLVRLCPTVNGFEQSLVYLGPLHAPQLVVSDAIIHRLQSDESDFVIASAFAHHSFRFVLATIIPIGCAVATAVTFLLPASIAFPFGIIFLIGFQRIVRHPVAFGGDYRAAQVTGFRVAASALAKIYAGHPVPNCIHSLLLGAIATYPSRDARLAALVDAAPLDDRPLVVPDAALIQKEHWATVAAGSVWLFLVLGTLAISIWGQADLWLAIALWFVVVIPITFSTDKQAKIHVRRSQEQWRFRDQARWAAIGLGILTIAVVVVATIDFILRRTVDEEEREIVFKTILVPISIGVVWLGYRLTRKRRTLELEVDAAVRLHDFRRVVDLCTAAPEIVRRCHRLRYHQALANAVCGNRQTAISSLEQLRSDKPQFPLAALVLGELLLDSGLAEQAAEVARGVARRLPRDPVVPALEARALRRLERIDEAQAACDRAMSFAPNDGSIHALAAAIELDRYDVDRAKELIAQGLELAPGDAFVLLVRAEIDLRVAGREQAQSSILEAIKAARSNPLFFFNQEINQLEAAIGEHAEELAAP